MKPQSTAMLVWSLIVSMSLLVVVIGSIVHYYNGHYDQANTGILLLVLYKLQQLKSE